MTESANWAVSCDCGYTVEGLTLGAASVMMHQHAVVRRCQHDWHHHPRALTGWGVVVCRRCGKTDIY